ncbi:DUF887-domain-containing protein [Microthyrium microscopicum]|uniref:DUF887-domain-containing protein n=1 Tax=Microthyrium microscopicum TaxID=703497 RepID=A0A6A6UT92_9PEZI|nr:DUF887-domain-containing protein [Microthyrium microscopicum]
MSALSNIITPFAHTLHLSTLPLHIHHLLAGYLFYEFLFTIVSPALSPLSRSYKALSAPKRIDWHTHVVSFIQCLIINSLALHAILTSPASTSPADRLWTYTPLAGRAQALAAGYFLWDVRVSIAHFDVLGMSSLIHGIAALGVTMLGFRPFANYYGLRFVLYELSTPFLNVHWFCDKMGLTGSSLQLYNGILLLVSFFGARIVWGGWQSWRIYSDVWSVWKDRGIMTKGCEMFWKATWVDVPLQCRELPGWLGGFYVGANTALTVLNVYWFGKMVQAVRRRFVVAEKMERDEKKES